MFICLLTSIFGVCFRPLRLLWSWVWGVGRPTRTSNKLEPSGYISIKLKSFILSYTWEHKHRYSEEILIHHCSQYADFSLLTDHSISRAQNLGPRSGPIPEHPLDIWRLIWMEGFEFHLSLFFFFYLCLLYLSLLLYLFYLYLYFSLHLFYLYLFLLYLYLFNIMYFFLSDWIVYWHFSV